MLKGKRADYVGDHGGRYTDIDGNARQFTYVDHDKHTTRLKSWKGSSPPKPLTPEEELVQDINSSGMNQNPFFIEGYDSWLASLYEFERYRKGSSVDNLADEYKKNWYINLEKLFKESIQKTIDELKENINKNYELQEQSDKENK